MHRDKDKTLFSFSNFGFANGTSLWVDDVIDINTGVTCGDNSKILGYFICVSFPSSSVIIEYESKKLRDKDFNEFKATQDIIRKRIANHG